MQTHTVSENSKSASERATPIDPDASTLSFGHVLALRSPAKLAAVAFSTELLIGAGQIRSVEAELASLRSRCNQEEDLTTDIDYFLGCNYPRNRRPVVLLFRKGLRLEAAVFLHEVCFVWVGTGLCRAGDSVGEGLLVAPETNREEFIRLAIDQLVCHQKRFHTLRLCAKTASGPLLAEYEFSGTTKKAVERSVRHTLPLASSYTEMLSNFGLRTRRSLGTKRRKLEESLRPEFFTSLAEEQSFEVMRYLSSRSLPVRSFWHLNARQTFLRSHPNAFAMALRSHDGTWLSFISGWRRNETTYVDMQLNHTAFKRESLSAVMRAFTLENEIAAGQKYITFVGGSSALLERYCTPDELVIDLVVSRGSIRGRCLKRAVERLCDGDFRHWLYL
jgi:hypothetical protein